MIRMHRYCGNTAEQQAAGPKQSGQTSWKRRRKTSCTAEVVSQLIVTSFQTQESLSIFSTNLMWSVEATPQSPCHLWMESGISCPSTGKGKPAPELCHEQVYICTNYTRPASFFTVLPGVKTSIPLRGMDGPLLLRIIAQHP